MRMPRIIRMSGIGRAAIPHLLGKVGDDTKKAADSSGACVIHVS